MSQSQTPQGLLEGLRQISPHIRDAFLDVLGQLAFELEKDRNNPKRLASPGIIEDFFELSEDDAKKLFDAYRRVKK